MFYEDPYVEFVNQEALKNGKYFVLDSGEGRGFDDSKNGWCVEDLSGWLIDPAEHETFIDSRRLGTVDDDFNDDYVFAVWSKENNGELKITFKKY